MLVKNLAIMLGINIKYFNKGEHQFGQPIYELIYSADEYDNLIVLSNLARILNTILITTGNCILKQFKLNQRITDDDIQQIIDDIKEDAYK